MASSKLATFTVALVASVLCSAGAAAWQSDFDKEIARLEAAAAQAPDDPRGYHLIAVYHYDKVSKDQRLSDLDRLRYADAGIAAADRAIALNADYADALVYKNLLLRVRATLETDDTGRQALIADANALRTQAIELQKTGRAWRPPALASTTSAPPPPPGEAPMQPVRVGGNIKPPAKLHDVKPTYPPEAIAQRVSGMVILEVIIAPDGRVQSAKVLRSIPELDAAAIEAVKGWRYETTFLNGVAVPVIMTVTVNFTLQ